MRRLPLVLVLSLGCIPIHNDVSSVASGLEQARLKRCSEGTADGPQWCQDIGGRCYDVRIGPDQAPAPDTDETRYDRTSACLLRCDGAHGGCPLHHQCQKRYDGLSAIEVCVPQGFCRGDADCVQAKYGGHLGTSHCILDEPAVCRAARANPLDSDGEARSHCDADSECIALMGEGAECYLQICQSPADANDWLCEDEALFSGRCHHADVGFELSSLQILEEQNGFRGCSGHEDCARDKRCVSLTKGLSKRCILAMPEGGCKAPTRQDVATIDNEPIAVCLPFIACVPNGRSSVEDHDRASCPGMGDETCSGEANQQMLVNQPTCGPEAGCDEGASCTAGICFVQNDAEFPRHRVESIQGCEFEVSGN